MLYFQLFQYHKDGTSPKGMLGTGTAVHWLGLDCDSLPSLAVCWEQEALTLLVFLLFVPLPITLCMWQHYSHRLQVTVPSMLMLWEIKMPNNLNTGSILF